MMQITDGLKDKVWQQIEAGADPTALPQLRAALAQVADPQQREAISDAALHLAGAWADAALWLGWRMRADPGPWIFQPAGTEE